MSFLPALALHSSLRLWDLNQPKKQLHVLKASDKIVVGCADGKAILFFSSKPSLRYTALSSQVE